MTKSDNDEINGENKIQNNESKIEKEESIYILKRKNHYKNIVIAILSLCLIICAVVLTPITIKKVTKKIDNIKIEKANVNYTYNSKYKLNLTSAYGDVEAYHPKVLAFKEKWNGYYYWMSYTPYPDSDESKENPHIVASNDMINWEEPQGFKNPLDEVKNGRKKRYNSDSHIVMNEDLNRLECYWRYVDDENNKVIIYRRCTTDGVNWSAKEAVAISNNRKEKKDFVSPAIIYENGIYKIWYIDKGNVIKYAEAEPDGEWKDIKTIKLEYPRKLQSWHIDVIKTDKGYEMLVMAYTNVKERGDASLYHTMSKDNNTWTSCTEIIKPAVSTKYWDNRGIYRSSMIKVDGVYYVFYSASNKDNIKGTGIMYGKDINQLRGIDIDYANDPEAVQKFQALINEEKNNN